MRQYSIPRGGVVYILRQHANHTTDVVQADVRPAPALYGPETRLAHYEGAHAEILGLVSWMYVSGLVRR